MLYRPERISVPLITPAFRSRISRRMVCSAAALAALTSSFLAPQVHAQGFLDSMAQSRISKQTVRLNTEYPAGTIIVSFGDRRLYRIEEGGQATSYPITAPAKYANWEGTLPVTMKRVNPSWRPTPSMIRKNPKLPSYVPGGHPQNPLGVRALYLGDTLYRIHGTDAPWTIGEAVSAGCIRMYNEDVKDLYSRTKIGAKVIVTRKKFQPERVAAR
ncbi:L,D-transpeptidase [Filomicrobium sp.]|uniref:L,D-transpeptidase n=1 Tax=Filomicrobium sp. TaxID=2024831 RepID=UPI00258DA25A|nr:L,D-transpeptidase [Filomicrobium sp.]